MPFVLISDSSHYLVSREFGEPKKGNHAAIYFCVDLRTQTKLALKALFTKKLEDEYDTMVNEAKMYVQLQKREFEETGAALDIAPRLYAHGNLNINSVLHPVFIMECLDEDLSSTLNVEPARAFAWGVQLIGMLRGVHRLGFFHSSIKPENVCRVFRRPPILSHNLLELKTCSLPSLSLTPFSDLFESYNPCAPSNMNANVECVYQAQQWGEVRLIDFGGCEPLGAVVCYKQKARAWLFCSRHLHKDEYCAPIDDLESLAFCLLEVCRNGRLPWNNQNAENIKQMFARRDWCDVFTDLKGRALSPLEEFMRALDATNRNLCDSDYVVLQKILSPILNPQSGVSNGTGVLFAAASECKFPLLSSASRRNFNFQAINQQQFRASLIFSVDRIVRDVGFAVVSSKMTNSDGTTQDMCYTVGLSVTHPSCSELVIFDASIDILRTFVQQTISLSCSKHTTKILQQVFNVESKSVSDPSHNLTQIAEDKPESDILFKVPKQGHLFCLGDGRYQAQQVLDASAVARVARCYCELYGVPLCLTKLTLQNATDN